MGDLANRPPQCTVTFRDGVPPDGLGRNFSQGPYPSALTRAGSLSWSRFRPQGDTVDLKPGTITHVFMEMPPGCKAKRWG